MLFCTNTNIGICHVLLEQRNNTSEEINARSVVSEKSSGKQQLIQMVNSKRLRAIRQKTKNCIVSFFHSIE